MSPPATLAVLDAAYRTHVGAGTRYALLDFPDHANVGDSAIWLGECALLEAITGRRPVYVSTWHDLDIDALATAEAEVVFLHGGGNLGDIWPHHQRFRETVLARVRDRPVVQLPQSIHFRDPGEAARFVALADAHPDFTLYVRDATSLAFAADRLAAPVRLVPDSAIALGAQPRGPAEAPLLMLLRSDDERRDHGAPPPAGARVVDWLDDAPDLPAGDDIAARDAQARHRVARGLALIAQGAVLVTDRLHGAILADLLALPHVVLDNDYGKIAAYRATWPAATPNAAAATMAEAVAAVARLAAG
ncbi:polysaccharide pyruvyl transferase family protein [Sphingomonas kyungheensis]|uniref:Polysaccharide pyruvyl transferase family protein n=1 Tax=Sphingomonas kyungheensis TaxID=1069987 RepID=A0ABU8H4J5_9SPHN